VETDQNHTGNHLSAESLKNYLDGNLSEKEMHRIEKHLLECPLCSEAIEGLESVSTEVIEKDLSDLEKDLQIKTLKKNNALSLSLRIAAAVALVAIGSYFIIDYTRQPLEEKEQLTRERSEVTTPDSLIAADENRAEARHDSMAITGIVQPAEEKKPSNIIEDQIESGSGNASQAGNQTESPLTEIADTKTTTEKEEVAVPLEQPLAAKPETESEPEVVAPPKAEETKPLTLAETSKRQSRTTVPKTQTMAKSMVEEKPSLSNTLIIEPIPQNEITSPAHPEGTLENYNKSILSSLAYPEDAAQNAVVGSVVIEFQVDSLGNLSDFQVINSLGFGCDEEAIRVIQKGPAWVPAKMDKRSTFQKVRISIPFKPEN